MSLIKWKQFTDDIRFLALQLKDKNFTRILVVTKGGMIPAYYLAKLLNIEYIDTICLSSYRGKTQKELKVLKVSPNTEDDWLIVDDLIDSGKTIREIKKYYPNSKVVTLYRKNSSPKPDYYTRTYPDKWITFPWEN